MLSLVTGGGGFLGRYIVEQLLQRGDSVRVLARGEYPDLAQQGVELVRGDVRDLEAVRRAATGCEAVFHVAAVPGIWGPWKTYYEINTLGTQHVIDACRSAGVSRLIHTSSPSVVYDGRPHVDADESLPYPQKFLCHYPHSKALAEQAVLAANDENGLRTVALRPHLIWGPRDPHLVPRLIARAKAGRLVRVGNGENIVSISYVENAAAAQLLAEESLRTSTVAAGQAYFINEPESVNLWRWIGQLLGLAQLPPVKRSVSPRLAYAAGAMLEGVYTVLPLPGEPPMTRFLASQLSQSHSYSIAKARRDLGDFSRVSFEEGMDRLSKTVKSL